MLPLSVRAPPAHVLATRMLLATYPHMHLQAARQRVYRALARKALCCAATVPTPMLMIVGGSGSDCARRVHALLLRRSRVKETTFYRDAEVEEDYCSMPVDVDDHDFTAGSEGDFGAAYVPEYDLLRKLQAVLPRRCKLTNNGLWLAGPFMFEDCGTPKNDAPEWHLFGGSS